MNQQSFTHAVTCPGCGTENILFEQVEFKNICVFLLSGGLGEVSCSQCGCVSLIRQSRLELIGDDEKYSLLMYQDRPPVFVAGKEPEVVPVST